MKNRPADLVSYIAAYGDALVMGKPPPDTVSTGTRSRPSIITQKSVVDFKIEFDDDDDDDLDDIHPSSQSSAHMSLPHIS